MKYHPVTTSKFAKDYDRAKKRGKDIKKLKGVIGVHLDGTKLAPKYKDHLLTGDCAGCRECHIEPDWLLIYEIQDNDMIFLRTGTHTDLFG